MRWIILELLVENAVDDAYKLSAQNSRWKTVSAIIFHLVMPAGRKCDRKCTDRLSVLPTLLQVVLDIWFDTVGAD